MTGTTGENTNETERARAIALFESLIQKLRVIKCVGNFIARDFAHSKNIRTTFSKSLA